MLHLTSNWKGGKKSQEVVAVFGGEDPQRLLIERERALADPGRGNGTTRSAGNHPQCFFIE